MTGPETAPQNLGKIWESAVNVELRELLESAFPYVWDAGLREQIASFLTSDSDVLARFDMPIYPLEA